RGPVGKELELRLLDAVLHLPAGAVELLVERLGLPLFAAERGDDEARVGFVGNVLGLADHPTPAAPALERRVAKLPEHPCRAPRTGGLLFSLVQRRREPPLQALIACQPKDVIHRILLAPEHQLLAGKTRIRPQDDAHARPAGADLSDEPLDFLPRPA